MEREPTELMERLDLQSMGRNRKSGADADQRIFGVIQQKQARAALRNGSVTAGARLRFRTIMNGHLFRQFPYTSVALALALMALVAGVFWNINVFDIPGIDLIGIERNEIGEIAIAFLLVIPAFFVDRLVARQRRHEVDLQAEQLRVLRVTMRTVQDIVNNNLNQLQLLRLEAEGHVRDETLMLFDQTIKDTAAELTALGNMEVFAEKPMASGPGLDVSTSSVRAR